MSKYRIVPDLDSYDGLIWVLQKRFFLFFWSGVTSNNSVEFLRRKIKHLETPIEYV